MYKDILNDTALSLLIVSGTFSSLLDKSVHWRNVRCKSSNAKWTRAGDDLPRRSRCDHRPIFSFPDDSFSDVKRRRRHDVSREIGYDARNAPNAYSCTHMHAVAEERRSFILCSSDCIAQYETYAKQKRTLRDKASFSPASFVNRSRGDSRWLSQINRLAGRRGSLIANRKWVRG